MSFLSKRIQQQGKQQGKPGVQSLSNRVATSDTAVETDEEMLLEEEFEETVSAAPEGTSQEPFSVGEGLLRVNVNEVRSDGSWVLDTGYVVPPKQRTPPKIAKLRKQLRSKLLAFPDEADEWEY